VCCALGLVLWMAGAAGASETFDGHTFYFGDLHSHTGVSGDGGSSDIGECEGDCGSLAGIGAHARSFGLDFLAVTEHVNDTTSATSEDFAIGLGQVLAQHDPDGGFLTIPGADLSFGQTGTGVKYGHKTLLMFAGNTVLEALDLDAVRPARDAGIMLDACSNVWEWVAEVSEVWGEVLLVPQHPALRFPAPTYWYCHDSTYSPIVEVYSEHGASMGLDDGFAEPWSGEHAQGTVRDALDDHGYKLGFVAGSSNHDSRPGDPCRIDSVRTEQPYGQGFTVAVLPEGEPFSRSTLYQALKSRSTYATTGPLLPVSIEWFSEGHSLGGMGGELGMAVEGDLSALIRVPEDLAGSVLEVKMHTPVRTLVAEPELEAGLWLAELDAGARPMWAFAEVLVDGELWAAGGDCEGPGIQPIEHLWLSPSWFNGTEDFDGDGWSIGEGDCDDYEASVHPLGLENCDEEGDEDCNGLADEADPSCVETEPGEDSGAPEPVDTGMTSPGDSADSGLPGKNSGFDPSARETKGSAACGGCAAAGGAGMSWLLALLFAACRRPE